MGTRSLTHIVNQYGDDIVVMYRQYDGYPEGHGKELATFLSPMRICNGIGSNQVAGQWANGMECLAAQIVAHFKKEIGGIYLYAANVDRAYEEYNYVVKSTKKGELEISVQDGEGRPIFEGSPHQYLTSFLSALS